MRRFLNRLFYGNSNIKKYEAKPYYKTQKKNLKDIWYNTNYNDFGIERILRLILQILAFIIPSGILRSLTGTTNLLHRRLAIELLAIVKIIIICMIFKFDLNTNVFFLIIVIISACDTLHFLASRIVLNDLFRKHISYTRSLIFTFINYVEVGLCFALIYSFIDHTSSCSNPAFILNESLPRTIDGHLFDYQVIYFSFITSATIGYGDIVPNNSAITKLVITQSIVSLFFIVTFISTITNKLGENTFYNEEKNSKEQ